MKTLILLVNYLSKMKHILYFTVVCMTIFDCNFVIFLMINYTVVLIPLKKLLNFCLSFDSILTVSHHVDINELN